MQYIMRNILIISLSLFSLQAFSQDTRLFEQTWYLHDLVIDGESNIPPINNEIPFIPAEFFETGELFTGMCEEGGYGELEYFGTTEFEILNIAFLAGGCYTNWPINQQYSGLYQGFWGLLQDGIVTYQIIDDGQLRTLIVTGVNNDYAVYRNEKLVLSLEDISKSEFLIYPTIVRTNFKINYNPDSEIQKITIYDAIGQMVSTIVNQDSEIDVSNLLSGIYFVVIQTNEGNITTKKIIKL
jgi:hypothetical protein